MASLIRAALPIAREEYRKERERRNYHDTLMGTCASVFNPGGPSATKSGYFFQTSEPLYERQEKSFDILLSNPEREAGAFIECKTGSSNPTREIRSIYEAIRTVSMRRGYLESAVGHLLRRRMFVLCTPSGDTQAYASTLQRLYADGEFKGEPPLYQWQVHSFQGERLEDFRLGPAPRGRVDNGYFDITLARVLRTPVTAGGPGLFAECYPSSHSLTLSLVALRHVLRENSRLGREPGTLHVDELIQFFSQRSTICHYAATELGPSMARRVVDDGKNAGLIWDMDPEQDGVLRFFSRGTQDTTILRQYERAFIAAMSKQGARRIARERYEAERERLNPPLAKWFTKEGDGARG